MSTSLQIRPVGAGHHAAWLPLWEGYQRFYKTEIAAATSDATWQRFLDADEPMNAALAWLDERAVGLVHWIYHRSCWTVGDYCYLQDLFVAEGLRGEHRAPADRACLRRGRRRWLFAGALADPREQQRRDEAVRAHRRQVRFPSVPQDSLRPTMREPLNWRPVATPPHALLDGRFVKLEPLDPQRHGDDLWDALQGPGADPLLWEYLAYGPFAERPAFDAWLAGQAASRDPLFFAVRERRTQRAVGLLSYLRITPKDGVIEIGHIAFGAPMQRTPGSTEAVYLLAELALGRLGYRRLEWKCNAGNARSMRAAERLGFTYEGTFRQHMVVKQRNRDTAWFSLLDSEWPARQAAFERWLDPSNFDAEGRQRQTLEALRD